MSPHILGLHHITAIAGNAKRNFDFYTKLMGLRMVKKTVNFDDPGTYHFYYGDEIGSAGTILTFFPWENIGRGTTGAGMATEIGYSVPRGSLEFWKERFKTHNISVGEEGELFGEQFLPFEDPDGLNIKLVVPSREDVRKPWVTNDISGEVAAKGFHSVTLTLRSIGPTATILTEIFGYEPLAREGNRHRYFTNAVENASIVDLLEVPDAPRGYNAAGTNHHVAFRVKDDSVLMDYREKITRKGLNITPKINRDYFFSLYFREPGGVLFELATENPGFTVDESKEKLGSSLKLPKQHEASRAEIEKVLPSII
jgi:glyoxalase family protein